MSERDDDDGRALNGPRPRARRRALPGLDGEIGAKLREHYGEIEREPIPSQLIELLERLGEAEAKAGK